MSQSIKKSWKGSVGIPDAGCVAYGEVWALSESRIKSFGTLWGEASVDDAVSFPGFGHSSRPTTAATYGSGLAVGCLSGFIVEYDLSKSEGNRISRLSLLPGSSQEDGAPVNAMKARGESLYAGGDGGILRIAAKEECKKHHNLGYYAAKNGSVGVSLAAGMLLDEDYLYTIDEQKYADDRFVALHRKSLDEAWHQNSVPADVPMGFGTKHVYVAGSKDGTHVLQAFDPSEEKKAWEVTLSDPPTAQPFEAAGRVWIPVYNDTANAGFLVEVMKDGTPTGIRIRLEERVTGRTETRGTVAYLCSRGEDILLVDVHENHQVTFATGPRPKILALDDQTLVALSDSDVQVGQPADVLDEYYCEGSLVQDVDVSDGADNATKETNFQTEIQLFDDNGSPRANVPVRVWTTRSAEVEWMGDTYQTGVDTTQSGGSVNVSDSFQAHTDSQGRIRLKTHAKAQTSDGEKHPGLRSAGLVLWSQFMDRNVRIHIRLDGEVHDDMATLDADELASATDYNGDPVVRKKYRNDQKKLSSAVHAIKKASGVVQSSKDDRAKALANGMHHCNGHCRPGVVCCCSTGDYSCKTKHDGTIHFNTDAGEDLAAAALPEFSLGDLWNKIKEGAARIVKATIDGIDSTIHAVIDGVKHVAQVALDTIEDVVSFVRGIWNEITEGVEKVLQYLSFVFDWDDILKTQDTLRDQVTTKWSDITSENGRLEQLRKKLNQDLGTIKKDVHDAIKHAKHHFSDKTSPTSIREEHERPGVGEVGSSKTNWLQSKVQTHALSVQGVARNTPGQTAAVQARDTTMHLPSLDLPSGLIDKLKFALKKLGQHLEKDLTDTFDDVVSDLSSMTASNVLSTAVLTFRDVLEGVVDVTIDAAQFAVDTIMALVREVLGYEKPSGDKTGIYKAVTTEITIPWVSDFYEWLTGDKLTILNLTTLIGAFGASVVDRITQASDAVEQRSPRGTYGSNGQPSSASKAPDSSSPPHGLLIAAGTLQMLRSLVQGLFYAFDKIQSSEKSVNQYGIPRSSVKINELMRTFRSFSFAFKAFMVIAQVALGVTLALGNAEPIFWVMWSAGALALVTDVLLTGGVILLPQMGKAYQFLQWGIQTICGVFIFFMSFVALAIHPHRPLISLFNTIVGIGKSLRVLMFAQDSRVRAATYLGTPVCILISGFLELSRILKSNTSPLVA